MVLGADSLGNSGKQLCHMCTNPKQGTSSSYHFVKQSHVKPNRIQGLS